MADLLDNCRGILESHRPDGRDEERVRQYGVWAGSILKGMRSTPVEDSLQLAFEKIALDLQILLVKHDVWDRDQTQKREPDAPIAQTEEQ